MSDNRDTQFKKFADLLQREQIAISYHGFINNWNSVDIERRQRENIARRAYDLVQHALGYSLEYLDECGKEISGGMGKRIMPSIPDMTELPKEQER